MTQTIEQKLTAIRQYMENQNLDAFIVPRADEYLGEYVPEHNQRLLWCSDFTGSAGTVIILKDRAAIFTDGRYTIQVKQQVNATLFEFHHLIDTPHMAWLSKQLPSHANVGFDAKVHNLNWYKSSIKVLSEMQINLIAVAQNPVDLSWLDRPQPTQNKGLLLAQSYTGLSSLEKRQKIGADIAKQGADAAIISALDSIAWLLNIRGKDIHCFCVILGSAILMKDGSMTFFTDPAKIPAGFDAHVGEGVTVVAESAAMATYQSLGKQGLKVLADPETSNAFCQLTAEAAGATLIPGIDPVATPKACKNNTELTGMQQAHIRDGASEVRFLCWLENEVAQGNLHDEAFLSDKLTDFRASNEHYVELSFDTISAAGANAAMCHYNHLNGTPAKLPMDSIYLVDSGAQYLDGTTDITRTVAIGTASDEQKKMFTLVLKGHIALAQIKFPEGTSGSQLDSLARQFLWQHGYDYDHGTGHGVGCFLNVHEGPQRIAKNSNGVALERGMVVSNEPGYYKQGEYGIRCENLVYVADKGLVNNGKKFYQFETLTLVPFDLRLIEGALLTKDEVNWINLYHAQVKEKISPLLTGADLTWLEQATQSI
ncbi:aminopeptidase P family protein [Psychromonas antarctica]|uniref:aminopeptidase P family protein n=1 Tax=Psychromonas antarctica TaxID=67573 RepID=UPI001EE85436|nr:aminopeptidase P family protein [Psychromonas antarctica]MCG6201054.1 aminopeptidase P family protein [Psychromonas antarctica]